MLEESKVVARVVLERGRVIGLIVDGECDAVIVWAEAQRVVDAPHEVQRVVAESLLDGEDVECAMAISRKGEGGGGGIAVSC